MKTIECRLCLAEIPHDYDHPLELTSEKANLDLESLDEVTFDYIEHNHRFRPLQKNRQWPDSVATAGVLFLLFISNASLYIIWLIFLGLYLKDFEIQDSSKPTTTWKVAVLYSISGTGSFLNGLVAFISERQLGSKLITFVSVMFGLTWCGILIWGKSKG